MGAPAQATYPGSRIEGIGRPDVEPSFIPDLVDAAMRISDPLSLAAAHLLLERTGHHAGGSTGTNLAGALNLVATMREDGVTGSVVTLICDSGERYRDSYYDDRWLAAQKLHLGPPGEQLDGFLQSGAWQGRSSFIEYVGERRANAARAASGSRKEAVGPTPHRRSATAASPRACPDGSAIPSPAQPHTVLSAAAEPAAERCSS